MTVQGGNLTAGRQGAARLAGFGRDYNVTSVVPESQSLIQPVKVVLGKKGKDKKVETANEPRGRRHKTYATALRTVSICTGLNTDAALFIRLMSGQGNPEKPMEKR